MDIQPFWIWMVIALGLGVVEVSTGTFYFLFLALAAALAGLVSLFGGLPVQVAVFAVATLISLPFVHRLVERVSRHAPEVKVGPERLIGQRATVVEAIDPVTGKGRVVVSGENWRAISDERIPEGRTVLVEQVQSNKLFVYREPVLEDDEEEEPLTRRLRGEEQGKRRLGISQTSPGEESQS